MAAQAEIQKQQALVNINSQLETVKFQHEIQKQSEEVRAKMMLMEREFQYNMMLKKAETENAKSKEKEKEDRKDERTRIQASQQSELIEQRKAGGPPKKFESAGNDILGGGFGMETFNPR